MISVHLYALRGDLDHCRYSNARIEIVDKYGISEIKNRESFALYAITVQGLSSHAVEEKQLTDNKISTLKIKVN
jgi:hypothetical protein